MKFLFAMFIGLLFVGTLYVFPEKYRKYYVSAGYSKLHHMLSLGNFYFKGKKFGKAEIIYEEILKGWSGNVVTEKAKFMLVEIEFFKRRVKEAREGYRLYLKEFPFGEFTYFAHSRLKEIEKMKRADDAL